ncbi:TonB-dependent siderophore receptor [Vreelandella utahensis]|uniref:TonB-dependent siderophore receptor n=1 Tax=Vreelandella halophila TaxID=86177 RepID=UPI000987B257|nr:TonB-dependent receptor [Halomonas utahensis]
MPSTPKTLSRLADPSPDHCRPSLLASVLRVSLLGISLSLVSTPLQLAQAQQQAETQKHYTIPAGPLNQSLSRFASQAGITLSFEPDLVKGKQAPSLTGNYSVEQGLKTLLVGTGINTRFVNPNTVALQGGQTGTNNMALDTLDVTASHFGASTEQTGAYTSELTSTATKLQMTPKNTPRIVNSVTHKVIDDFAMQDMEDILSVAPGVSVSHTDDDRRNYTARGYPMAIQYNGMPSTSGIDGGVVAGPDSAVIDHVDVLLGPSGLMSGAGEPGGVINMVYKQPTKEFQASAKASVGSWNMQRMVGDISGPLSDSGDVRTRLIAVDQSSDSFRDYEKQKKSFFYGVVEGDITDTTTLSLSMQRQDIYDNVTDRSGLPTDNDGNDMGWDRSTFLAPAWNRWDKYGTTYKLRLEQQLAADWQLITQASRMKSEADWLFGTYSDFDSTTGDATFRRWAQYNKETSEDLELFLRGPLQLFGREHDLVLGGNWTERVWGGREGEGTDVVANLYDFDPRTSVPRPEIVVDTELNDQITEQFGGYLAGRFNVTDPLDVIIGSRLSWYHYEFGDTVRDEDAVFTPYGALVYELNNWSSAYATYSEIFNPQSNKGVDGNTLEPEVGSNYEVGVKGEFYDGALNTSLALFRIRKDNEAQLLQPYDANNICGGWCYEAKGETITKGVDLGLSGEVVEGVQVMAGFTQYKKDDNDETVRITKLSGSYSPEGARWSLGASIDDSTKSYGQWGMSQDARTLVGLFGKYQINPRVKVALNVKNALDEEYYANAIDSGYGNQYWGEPRSGTLSVTAEW